MNTAETWLRHVMTCACGSTYFYSKVKVGHRCRWLTFYILIHDAQQLRYNSIAQSDGESYLWAAEESMKQCGQGSNIEGSEDGIAVRRHLDVVQARRQLEHQIVVLVPMFFGALMQQVSTLQQKRKVKAGSVVEPAQGEIIRPSADAMHC